MRCAPFDAPVIAHGPVTLFIVRTGSVRVAYRNGAVCVFAPGRYAVHDATFSLDVSLAASSSSSSTSESSASSPASESNLSREAALAYDLGSAKNAAAPDDGQSASFAEGLVSTVDQARAI